MVKHAPRFVMQTRRTVTLGLAVALCSLMPVFVLRADAPRDGAESAKKANVKSESGGKPDDGESEAERQRRERVVTGGMLLLAGIAAAGAALVGLVVLWGVRVRRVLRRPLPEQSARDNLWYLRPKKETPSGGARDASEADDGEAEP